MVKVKLDAWLREFGPRSEETIDAGDLGSLFDKLESLYPRLRFRLRDETGAVRKYVKVFVDGEEFDSSVGTRTPIGRATRIDILHSIAGG